MSKKLYRMGRKLPDKQGNKHSCIKRNDLLKDTQYLPKNFPFLFKRLTMTKGSK